MNSIKDQILDLSRQNNIGALTVWFDKQLNLFTNYPHKTPHFLAGDKLEELAADIVRQLEWYRIETKVENVVLGMSGGVDSALTAALFKKAGWNVTGVTLPINQNPAETERGVEACNALGITHQHIDLSDMYAAMLASQAAIDPNLTKNDDEIESGELPRILIRRGNIRARLRMITLYNLAAAKRGLVASTDNFSELCAGFWTLHGDVGDLAPIQSLLKSWEVPYLARHMGVPETTWRATPTDGLGISNGDEAQLGASYLEWDLMVLAIHEALNNNFEFKEEISIDLVRDILNFGDDERADAVFDSVISRMRWTWFKRQNPLYMENKFFNRFETLRNIDFKLCVPKCVSDRIPQDLVQQS